MRKCNHPKLLNYRQLTLFSHLSQIISFEQTSHGAYRLASTDGHKSMSLAALDEWQFETLHLFS